MQIEELRSKIANFPKESGVYIFRDSKGKPIYIGKATGLRSRVSSYLKASDSRIAAMVQTAASIEYRITGSDIEALIVESKLIKKYKPQFNIVMRDDKQYFFVAITDQEYPRIFLTHQPTKEYGIRNEESGKIRNSIFIARHSEFIGPFTDGTSLKVTLKQLRKLFPYCTCKQSHNVPCLNYHIGKCLGFCCLRQPELISNFQFSLAGQAISKREYLKNIRTIRDLLSGKRASVIKELEKEMKNLGSHGDFEKAIELQNKIERIRRVFENARIIQTHKENQTSLEELRKTLKLRKLPERIEGYDISNISGTHATGSMVVFEYGKPDKDSYRKFKIRTVKSSDDTAMLREVLTRRLNHPEWPYPDLVIIDGGKGQLNVAHAILGNNPNIHVIGLTKNQKHIGDHVTTLGSEKFKLIPLTKFPINARNLILSVDSEAHRFAISYYRILHRKSYR